jgi:ribosomal protein L33
MKKIIIVCDKCGEDITDSTIYYLSGSMSNDINSLSVQEFCKICSLFYNSNNNTYFKVNVEAGT